MSHKPDLHEHDADIEPAPAYATDAEIKLAQRLREQLEERYFGASPERPPPKAKPE